MHEPRLLLDVVCSLSLCRCKWPPCLISKKNLWLSLFHPVWRRYFTDIVEDKRLMHRAIPMTSIPYPRFLSLLSPGFRCFTGWFGDIHSLLLPNLYSSHRCFLLMAAEVEQRMWCHWRRCVMLCVDETSGGHGMGCRFQRILEYHHHCC